MPLLRRRALYQSSANPLSQMPSQSIRAKVKKMGMKERPMRMLGVSHLTMSPLFTPDAGRVYRHSLHLLALWFAVRRRIDIHIRPRARWRPGLLQILQSRLMIQPGGRYVSASQLPLSYAGKLTPPLTPSGMGKRSPRTAERTHRRPFRMVSSRSTASLLLAQDETLRPCSARTRQHTR